MPAKQPKNSKHSAKSLTDLYLEHAGKVSDKWTLYIEEYDRLFSPLRKSRLRMLEIGVQNGGSLEVWAEYFRNAKKIVGCDIDNTCGDLRYDDERIEVVVGNANDDQTHKKITSVCSAYDLVIDDGSHRSGDVVQSFARYFPCLTSGGLYVVEDMHCSYWSSHDGGLFHPYSAIAFFKRLVDCLNSEHWGVHRSALDLFRGTFRQHRILMSEASLEEIHSIEFLNSLCVIRKAPTSENRVGHRRIAGLEATINSEVVDQNGAEMEWRDQTGNRWSKSDLPPEEEVPILQAQQSELRQLLKEGWRSQEQALKKVESYFDKMVQLKERCTELQAGLDLARGEADEARKATAQLGSDLQKERTNVARMRYELDEVHDRMRRTRKRLKREQVRLQQATSKAEEAEMRIRMLRLSRSWRITRPLRSFAGAARWIVRNMRRVLTLIVWMFTGQYQRAIHAALPYYRKGIPAALRARVPQFVKRRLGRLESSQTGGVSGQSRERAMGASPKSLDLWDTRKIASEARAARDEGLHHGTILLLPISNRERNTKRYRIDHLAEQLKHIGFEPLVLDFRSDESQIWRILEEPDVPVILQRFYEDESTRPFLRNLRDRANVLVYEIDDQLFYDSELEVERIKRLDAPPQAYWRAMQLADQYFVSTKALRNLVEQLTQKPVHVIQNVLCREQTILSRHAAVDSPATKDGICIGYAAGSATHDADFAEVEEALGEVLNTYPQVHLSLIGFVSPSAEFLRLFQPRIRLEQSVSWKDLPERLARFDIQVIPLQDVPFNRYKSHIRWLESSAVGCPVVMSNVGEQTASAFNGKHGLIVENRREAWVDALKSLIESHELRTHLGQHPRHHVSRYFTTDSPFVLYRLKAAMSDVLRGQLSDKISVVLVTYNPIEDSRAAIQSIVENTTVPFELYIWNNSHDADLRQYVRELDQPNVLVVDFNENVGKARAANYFFDLAVHRFVCGLDDDYLVPCEWDSRMIKAAKAVPNLGWLSTNLTEESSGLRGLGETKVFSGGVKIGHAKGVGGWMVFTTASARERIGYYQEHGVYGGIDGDYNRRSRRMRLFTGYVLDVVGAHKINRQNNLAWELHKQRIQDQMRRHGKASDAVTDKFIDFFKEHDQRLKVSIKICTSVTHDENVWGDTHFGRGLKRALEKLGYVTRVDKHEDWYATARSDVTIHLFGLHKFEPDPDSINILWIISHPELVDSEFVERFDLILVASETFARQCESMVTDRVVEFMPQATDIDIFKPTESQSINHDIVFVGNSRRVFRESVRFAVQNDLPLQVWGTKWEQFIDNSLIKDQSLPMEQVAELYRSAKVVLNDHWEGQKQYGFVNNRILDVLACGGMVLTDWNEGISSLLGDFLPTFKSEPEFVAEAQRLLNDDQYRAELSSNLMELVRSEHSFDSRAQRLHTLISRVIVDYVDYKSERTPTTTRSQNEILATSCAHEPKAGVN